MITAVTIENFRGIAHGEVSGLKPLTVLVGANNSGKSTILEALYIGAAEGVPAAWHRAIGARGWIGLETVRNIAYRNCRRCVVTTTDGAGGRAEYCAVGLGVHTTPGEFGGSGEDVVGVELSSLCSKTLMQVSSSGELLLPAGATVDPKVVLIGVGTVHAVRDHEASYSVAAEAGTQVQSELLALCAVLRRATKDIRILKKDNDFILHTIDQDGACPFYLAGDGLRRLFDIACRLAVARGGLVLVEEPECFQHPKAMDEFTRLLWAAIGQGTQVVFSTHSLELLAKVFEAGEGRDLSKACIMRTRLEDGVLTTLNIEGRNASERLTDVGEDLRR